MGKFFNRYMENLPEAVNRTEALFLTLMSCIPGQSWFSTNSLNGESMGAEFIAGVNLPNGTVTLVMPLTLVGLANKTGASLIPLPHSIGTTNPRNFIETLVQFANR